MLTASAMAKSLVLTLNDSKSTKVYYKLGGDVNPRMVLGEDGTFSVNGKEYTFKGVKNFFISNEDYTGQTNTIDAIVAIDEDGSGRTTGVVRVYNLDGRLVQTREDGTFDLNPLPRGTYVINNGVSTIKVMKR